MTAEETAAVQMDFDRLALLRDEGFEVNSHYHAFLLRRLPANLVLRLFKTGRLTRSPEARAAWAQHGPYDHYLTLAQVRTVCASHLPGAEIRRHLLWRYSIGWAKPTWSNDSGTEA